MKRKASRQSVGASARVRSPSSFATLARDQEPLDFEPQEFIADGNRVVALGNSRFRVNRTGQTFATDCAHVFTVRNGKIAGF